MKVAVYGSAKPNSKNTKLAFLLGQLLAKKRHILITGAASGISAAAARGFNHKNSIGYSPTKDTKDAENFSTIKLKNMGKIVHTGKIYSKIAKKLGLRDQIEEKYKFRNFISAVSCDVAICIEGSFGTLTEIINVLGLNKKVIVLSRSGGVSDAISFILDKISLKKGNLVVVNNPYEAIDYIDKLPEFSALWFNC